MLDINDNMIYVPTGDKVVYIVYKFTKQLEVMIDMNKKLYSRLSSTGVLYKEPFEHVLDVCWSTEDFYFYVLHQ